MNKINDYLLEFYEKAYFHELDLREKLISRIQITLSVAAPILGAIAYLFLNYNFANNSKLFLFFLGLSLLSLCLAIGYLVSLFFYKAAHLQNTEILNKNVDQICEYDIDEEKKLIKVQELFIGCFVKSATANYDIYTKKAKHLKYANLLFVSALIFLAIAFFVFSYYGLDRTPEVTISKPITISNGILPFEHVPFPIVQPPTNKDECKICPIPPTMMIYHYHQHHLCRRSPKKQKKIRHERLVPISCHR